MKTRRGVSPLIATVLIIGFTIVLAAVVMQWGGAFVRQLTEEQAAKTETATSCIGMNFEIAKADYTGTGTGGSIITTITNNVDKKIAGFVALLDQGTASVSIASTDNYVSCGTIGTDDGIESFATEPCSIPVDSSQAVDIVVTDGDGVDKLKLVPMIEGKDGSKSACTIDSAVSRELE
ncbi:hypothetical protein J4427_01850 [Candidatus Woesearchaeota archaeon]|nr:hypothetical protein [Candidatus Woesearchaeota archaeon]